MGEAIVHLIDDDQGVRDSLGMLLESAGFSVELYPDAAGFLRRADLARPGCVVADVRMPGMNGLELLRWLKDRDSRLPVIIITGHAHVAMAVQALKEGAADFIEKPFDDTAFINSVRDALDLGQRAFLDLRRRSDIQAHAAALTPREREVMALIVQGLSNKAAAVELTISVRTVEIHRARVMDKMGAESLSALVRMALELEEHP